MKYYIYQLVTNNEVFYIGRTINPKRRLQEHIRGGLNFLSTELKYQFIYELNSIQQEWDLEVIATYTDNKHPYEDWHIDNAIKSGATLTNMKKGDVYEEATTHLTEDYKTADDFFKAREVKVKELLLLKERNKHKTKKKREVQHSGESAFIDDLSDVINGRRESPALKAIKARRNKI